MVKRSSLGKSVLSNASDAASSKRARRATTDFIDANSAALSGTSLGANVQTPRPTNLSAGSPGNSSARAESPSIPSSQKVSTQAQARPSVTSRATSPGRRGAKSGTLHTPNGSADQSLMSIVENVARQNRERNIASALATLNGHASSSSGNLPVLEVPRAPSLQVAQTSSTVPGVSARERPGQQVPNGRPRSLDLQRSESVSSTSRVNAASIASSNKPRSAPSSKAMGTPTSSVVGGSGTSPSTSSQLAKVPLHPALRNASRTPSPHPRGNHNACEPLPGTQQICHRV
ncbi:hypothetical protein PISMIDRAFT_615472 [Pisolithus microcarpus 441]|uniref:Uncharacterized protein n=1 Tax=Pisolithus microcarpus 441 TaxID=765257 RepID=A0A0C9YTD3_9AGAM|nr:hypothetical protein BKA83DRAFT_615472 [Pisolithus microcarpus]KIK19951.1 hypothetical protein PISMIDRAFT_615472 [Pisolithus microcarpus 441]